MPNYGNYFNYIPPFNFDYKLQCLQGFLRRARERFKLYAHLLSSYECLVNLSVSVVVLRANALNKYITVSSRCKIAGSTIL